MKAILFLGLFALMTTHVLSEPTILTYFTEHEVEQDSDYIEIGINVSSEDRVLKKAIDIANGVVNKLQKIVLNYCSAQANKKSECEDVFEASKNKIEPKYQMVRKIQTFMAFIVKHKVTIKVRKFQGLGKMTDQLLLAGDKFITIESFEWKQEDEQNPERKALTEGVQDGKEICERMGLKMSRIISVTEVQEKEETEKAEENEGEENDQEEAEEEEPAEQIIFKFEVECS